MSQPLFKRFGLLAATAITAVTLIACGGGGSAAPVKVVALSDLKLDVNPANKQLAFELLTAATSGYTFTSGLTLGGNNIPGPVQITLGGKDADNMTYTMVDGNKVTSTGTFKFGSCIIEIPAGQPYAGSYTINNCSVSLALKGKALTVGGPFKSEYVWSVANWQSVSFFPSYEGLSIDASGNVTYSSQFYGNSISISLGTVSVIAATGATGGN